MSLFSGAGGLDYGLEAAGFDIAVANDFDHDSCETVRRRRPSEVLEASIFDVPTEQLLRVAGVRAGEVDLVVGGPPCQPFSKSGYWAHGDTRRLEDPRADTLSAFFRVVQQALPRAFLLENVDGLAFNGKSEGLAFVLEAINRINSIASTQYAPRWAVLNAADFGVPQVRRRLFIIAARDGRTFQFPAGFGAYDEGERRLVSADAIRYYRCAWDALADVKPDPGEDLRVRGKWGQLLAAIPEGQNYLWHTDRGGGLPLFGWRRRYWGFLLKLAKSRPSWTLQAQPGPAIGPFHWENRRLSARELCRLQTFPDDVVVVGSRLSVQRQIGNAVPSLLSEVLGRAIRGQLLGLPSLDGPLRLLPPRHLPVPGPEAVTDVPAQYRGHTGFHSAHPGTGRGHGALRRPVKVPAAATLPLW